MTEIEQILSLGRIEDIINELKYKTVVVKPWSELEKAYDKKKHPIFTDPAFADIIKGDKIIKQCRIGLGLPKLSVKRIGELCFGIPVRRVYKPKGEQEKTAARIIENIFHKNKINSVNLERSKYLYAACEFATIWYAQEMPTEYGEEKTSLRLRCKTYSPMTGTQIYPLFDSYDDLIALSMEYTRQKGAETTRYFETYTADRHIRWQTTATTWEEEVNEVIGIGKIVGVYQYRDAPIWEDEADNVYEMEYQLSRQGNYLRKNLKPKWVVCTDETIQFGNEKDGDGTSRDVLKYPKDAQAGYKTWDQAIDSLKYHIETLRQNFFSQLQLPEMSSDAMKSMPMSAESRKMIFIDGQLKVSDESGLWYDTFYREINIIRAFCKKMFPKLKAAFDSLTIEVIITPYQVQDEKEKIGMYSDATGGKQVMSQRTSIERLGYVDDVDEELQRIADEAVESLEVPTI